MPFLKSGAMLALTQSSGSLPVNDCVKMACNSTLHLPSLQESHEIVVWEYERQCQFGRLAVKTCFHTPAAVSQLLGYRYRIFWIRLYVIAVLPVVKRLCRLFVTNTVYL